MNSMKHMPLIAFMAMTTFTLKANAQSSAVVAAQAAVDRNGLPLPAGRKVRRGGNKPLA